MDFVNPELTNLSYNSSFIDTLGNNFDNVTPKNTIGIETLQNPINTKEFTGLTSPFQNGYGNDFFQLSPFEFMLEKDIETYYFFLKQFDIVTKLFNILSLKWGKDKLAIATPTSGVLIAQEGNKDSTYNGVDDKVLIKIFGKTTHGASMNFNDNMFHFEQGRKMVAISKIKLVSAMAMYPILKAEVSMFAIVNKYLIPQDINSRWDLDNYLQKKFVDDWNFGLKNTNPLNQIIDKANTEGAQYAQFFNTVICSSKVLKEKYSKEEQKIESAAVSNGSVKQDNGRYVSKNIIKMVGGNYIFLINRIEIKKGVFVDLTEKNFTIGTWFATTLSKDKTLKKRNGIKIFDKECNSLQPVYSEDLTKNSGFFDKKNYFRKKVQNNENQDLNDDDLKKVPVFYFDKKIKVVKYFGGIADLNFESFEKMLLSSWYIANNGNEQSEHLTTQHLFNSLKNITNFSIKDTKIKYGDDSKDSIIQFINENGPLINWISYIKNLYGELYVISELITNASINAPDKDTIELKKYNILMWFLSNFVYINQLIGYIPINEQFDYNPDDNDTLRKIIRNKVIRERILKFFQTEIRDNIDQSHPIYQGIYFLLMLIPLKKDIIEKIQKSNIYCPLISGGFRESGQVKVNQLLVTRSGEDYEKIGYIYIGHYNAKIITNYSGTFSLITKADHIVAIPEPLSIYRFPTYSTEGTYKGFSTQIYDGEKQYKEKIYDPYNEKSIDSNKDLSIKPCFFLDTEIKDLLKKKAIDLTGIDSTLLNNGWITHNQFGDNDGAFHFKFAPFMNMWNYDKSGDIFQSMDNGNTFPINTLCFSDTMFDLNNDMYHFGSGPFAKFTKNGDNDYRDGKKKII